MLTLIQLYFLFSCDNLYMIVLCCWIVFFLFQTRKNQSRRCLGIPSLMSWLWSNQTFEFVLQGSVGQPGDMGPEGPEGSKVSFSKGLKKHLKMTSVIPALLASSSNCSISWICSKPYKISSHLDKVTNNMEISDVKTSPCCKYRFTKTNKST